MSLGPGVRHAAGQYELVLENGDDRRLAVLQLDLLDENVDLAARVDRRSRVEDRQRVDDVDDELERSISVQEGHEARSRFLDRLGVVVQIAGQFDQLDLRIEIGTQRFQFDA